MQRTRVRVTSLGPGRRGTAGRLTVKSFPPLLPDTTLYPVISINTRFPSPESAMVSLIGQLNIPSRSLPASPRWVPQPPHAAHYPQSQSAQKHEIR